MPLVVHESVAQHVLVKLPMINIPIPDIASSHPLSFPSESAMVLENCSFANMRAKRKSRSRTAETATLTSSRSSAPLACRVHQRHVTSVRRHRCLMTASASDSSG